MSAFLAAIVSLTNMCGVVSVDTHGARVVSYVPEGGEEVFFMSETGMGGMPLCWPWFGGNGPCEDSRRHGIARYRDFEIVSTNRIGNDTTLTLRLKSDDESRRQFPHDFDLTVSVRMNDRLTICVTGENTGTEPFEVTEAIHPYFAVSDSQKCRVEGFDAPEYRLKDPVAGWTLSFSDEGGKGRHEWRPNAKSHLSKSVSHIAPDDWRKFICLENGTFKKADAYILKPGERHTLSRTIRLSSTYDNAKAIDLQPQIEAASAAGGGRVTVPPGEWLADRAVHLRSNVELHLAAGATLVFPDDPDAYLPAVRSSYSAIEFYGLSPLVYAYGATNVSVTGAGTLTTRMGLWRDWFLRETATMDENQRRLYEWGESDTPVEERRFEDLRTARIRPAFVEFERCANVRLDGFRIRYSPLWCVHLRLCDGVVVRGLDICAKGHNNDGIDVNASRNVLIEDCTLNQGDDAFVIKSGRDRDGRRVGMPCENVEIRNCTVKGAITLLGVGSEVSGGVRNISLHDCRVTERANAVIRVKTSDRKGAYIENVAVSNVAVAATADIGALVSLITNIDYQWRKYPPREHIVTRIDGFRVENVTAGPVRKVYALYGDARLPPENIVIRNVTATSCRERSIARNIGRCELPDVIVLDGACTNSVLKAGEEMSSWSTAYNTLFDLDAAADDAWRAVGSVQAFDERRRALREKMAMRIGGFPVERTPLNATTTGSVERNGYKVEKILFESRPGAYVTGNLYLPAADRFMPPYPAAIELCGHSSQGKGDPNYRRVALLAARCGIAVLVIDPLCQGERRQCEEEKGNNPTVAHLRLGVNAMLLGHGLAAFEMWDAMRALDYLDSRADIRHDGYGSFGNSGGGTQSVMLSALDDRVKATATSCFLSNLREQTAWRLLADSEQLIFAQLKDGLNHAAYPLLGGNPVLMLARRDDMIPFTGTRETFRVLTAVGANLNRSGWYSMCDFPGPHGYCEQSIRATVTFLVERLRGEKADLSGVDCDMGPEPEALSVTPTGQVMDLPGFKSAYSYLHCELDAAEAGRRKMSAAELSALVRRIADIDEGRVGVKTVVSEETMGDVRVVKSIFEVKGGYHIPAVELTPAKITGLPVLITGDGMRSERIADAKERLVAGHPVMLVDIVATGEIGGTRHHYNNPHDDEETAKMLYLVGSSLVGRRAGEIIVLANDLKARYGKPPLVVAHGRTAVAAAHARAAAPDAFAGMEVADAPITWAQSVRTRAFFDYAASVHGALLHYDWPDLL